MQTIITGAAGFIGYHLASKLADQGEELILIDNFQRGEIDDSFNNLIKRSNVQFHNIDLTQNNALDFINSDVSKIYHLASINGTENFYKIPHKVLRVNVLSTLNILEWAKDKTNIKILYSSSSEVYAGSITLGIGKIPTDENVSVCIDDITNVRWSYGASKLLAENAFYSYAKTYPINFSIVRYHNIYGPRMGYKHVIPQLFQRIYNRELPLKLYGGNQTRAFCYVTDAVNATKLAMDSKNADLKIVHIGNDQQEIKINELAKKMLGLTKNQPIITEERTPEGSVQRRCPDIKFIKSIGFSPEIGLELGLSKTNDWYYPIFNVSDVKGN